jgi:hypothetical protein
MARTDAGAELTDQHRQAQAAVNAAALRDYVRLWPLWRVEDQSKPQDDDHSFPALAAALLILIRAHHKLSTSLAAEYFDAFRGAERVQGSFSPRLADPVNTDKVTSALYVTGRVMTRRAMLAGKSPLEARQVAFVRTAGLVTQEVLRGGRDTIILSTGEDPKALKWARVTNGTPCAFCAMLASRGAVYLGHDTAEFRPHLHCNCQPEPHYEGAGLPVDSQHWRDLYNRAQREARASDDLERGTSDDALNAFRRALTASRG